MGYAYRPSTFLLHTEAMNLLLVMASTQLTSPAGSTGATAHPFLATMMTKTQLAPALVRDYDPVGPSHTGSRITGLAKGRFPDVVMESPHRRPS